MELLKSHVDGEGRDTCGGEGGGGEGKEEEGKEEEGEGEVSCPHFGWGLCPVGGTQRKMAHTSNTTSSAGFSTRDFCVFLEDGAIRGTVGHDGAM